MAITPKLDIFDLKMTTATRTYDFLLGESQEQSLAWGQPHHRPNLISITTGSCNSGNVFLASGRLIKPMVMHISLVTGRYMLQKPQKKLRGWKRQSLILLIPVVPICDSHFPSIISDNPFFGKRWTSGVSAAVCRSFSTVSVSGHHIDNKASRILLVEPSYDPLRAPIPSECFPQ
jgi:hypothetical protein